MTTEDDFRRALDADPDDNTVRLAYADWLDEHDDPRAEGYRALARYPRLCEPGAMHSSGQLIPRGVHVVLMHRTFDAPDGSARYHWWITDWRGGAYMRASCREAEDAVALAFAQLPPEHRAELLT